MFRTSRNVYLLPFQLNEWAGLLQLSNMTAVGDEYALVAWRNIVINRGNSIKVVGHTSISSSVNEQLEFGLERKFEDCMGFVRMRPLWSWDIVRLRLGLDSSLRARESTMDAHSGIVMSPSDNSSIVARACGLTFGTVLAMIASEEFRSLERRPIHETVF